MNDFLGGLLNPVDRWIWRHANDACTRYYRDGSGRAWIRGLGYLMRIATRRATIDRMKTVLGADTRSDEEWAQLWRSHADEVGHVLVEMVWLNRLPHTKLAEIVTLKGEEHLKAALAKSRGAMLFLSHLGAMGTVAAALGPRGYDLTIAGQKLPRPFFEEKLRLAFREAGVKRLVLSENLPLRSAEIFRLNGVFAAFFDHTIGPKHNIWAPFGRAETSISIAPAMMALRCGAPILCVRHRRLDATHFETEISPPLEIPDENAPMRKKSEWATRQAIAWLAPDVAGRPEQWWPWDYAVTRPARAEASRP